MASKLGASPLRQSAMTAHFISWNNAIGSYVLLMPVLFYISLFLLFVFVPLLVFLLLFVPIYLFILLLLLLLSLSSVLLLKLLLLCL